MASSSRSHGQGSSVGGARDDGLLNPELAAKSAADLMSYLNLNRNRQYAFVEVMHVLADRERRLAAAEAEILHGRGLSAAAVEEGLRDEIRRAADTETRLRAELRACQRRADDAEARLRLREAEMAPVPASSDSGGASGSRVSRTRRLPPRFVDYEVELDQPASSDLLARLAEAEAQIRVADRVADSLRDQLRAREEELRRAQAWVRSGDEARQRRAAETEAELEALNELLWRMGLDNGRQASADDTGAAQVDATNAPVVASLLHGETRDVVADTGAAQVDAANAKVCAAMDDALPETT